MNIKSSRENFDYIFSAACVLHNFIRQRNDKSANETKIQLPMNLRVQHRF